MRIRLLPPSVDVVEAAARAGASDVAGEGLIATIRAGGETAVVAVGDGAAWDGAGITVTTAAGVAE